MNSAVLNLIQIAEELRIRVLRWTLFNDTLKKAFRHRAIRLFSLFSIAVIIYFPLSLYFPLWMLAIGPVVWGVPHIFASLRYQDYSHRLTNGSPQRMLVNLRITGSILVAVAILRIISDVFQAPLQSSIFQAGNLETLAAIIAFVSFGLIYRVSTTKWLVGSLLMAALASCMWLYPYESVGILILGHNFIAFFYWMRSAQTASDKVAAASATAIFTLLHFFVFAKVFDPLINWMPSPDFLDWAGLSIDEIGRSIAPWSEDRNLFYRSVSLYAFGQALHYFVWMKAIPDLNAPSTNPTCFRLSWNLLNRDLGKRLAMISLVVSLIPLSIWLFATYQWSHVAYFAVASFHGYFEIAGLALLISGNSKT